MTESFVGARIGRFEDRTLLTGQAQYLDDIHMAGMLEVAFVRSPHPHALIRGIDASAALALPGVHAVYSHADLAAVLTTDRIPQDKAGAKFPDTTWPVVLPKAETCFVGEPIAAVVADSRYIAEDAVALVDVEYEPLTPAADCRDAAAPGAPKAHLEARDNIVTEFRTDYGDCAAAFAAAEHVFAISLKQHRGAAHPIEGRGTIASYNAVANEMTVWASVQTPHKLRNGLMELLGVDESGVRVIVPDVGGAFGGKNLVYPEDVMVAVAARLLQRPIKWAEDRREHFLAAVQERDQYWDLEIACDAEGRIEGVRGTIIHDQGAYTLLGLHTPHNCSIGVPGPYVVPNYQIDVAVVETNKVGCVPIRGAGYPEASFAMERLLDEIARGLDIDRAELRRRNLVPADRMPYEHPMKTREGTPTIYDTGDFPACQVQALETADYAGFAQRQAQARTEGHYLGIGVSNMVKVTGRGPFESGVVRVGRSGRVSVFTGAMEMGQGTRTSFAQICAEHLGVAPGEITVVAGDTGAVLHGIGGYGSRQTVTGGSSVHLAHEPGRHRQGAGRRQGLLPAQGGHALAAGERQLPAIGRDLRQCRPRGRGRGRYRHRRRQDPALCRGQRQRPVDQPDHRRGPTSRRHRARHRQRAVRMDGLRRERPAGHHDPRRLPATDGARGAELRDHPRRDPFYPESAGRTSTSSTPKSPRP